MHGKDGSDVDVIEMQVPDGESMTVDFVSGKVSATSREEPTVFCQTCASELRKGVPHPAC